MNTNDGLKEFLKDVAESFGEAKFFNHFTSGCYFSIEEDDYVCDLCDFSVQSYNNVDDYEAIDAIQGHLFEEHAITILKKELMEFFMPNNNSQTTLEE